jgi:hypothetical protein
MGSVDNNSYITIKPTKSISKRALKNSSLKLCSRGHFEKYDGLFFFPPTTILLKVDLQILLIQPHLHLSPQYCLFY